MVQYDREALDKLNKSLCRNCDKNLLNWDKEVFSCWIKYLKGVDRKELISGTRFNQYSSLKYYFKDHPCYNKIASTKKRFFRPVKTKVLSDPKNYPWLIGLFYADGFIRTRKTQLAFVLGINEEKIVQRVEKELREIVGEKSRIARDIIGNMIQIRIHSSDLCRSMPDKKSREQFLEFWKNLGYNSKMQVIGGFIDGDGSCQYEVGINSIQIYSKVVPFILEPFKDFLSDLGYVSQKDYRIYISPAVGKILKPYVEKRNISTMYRGDVDIESAYKMLKENMAMREIARKLNKDRKTITLALKKVYGIDEIQKYLNLHNTKLNFNR